MAKIYAMQRANGEFFTVSPNRVAVWLNWTTLEMSRAHNLDLDVYRPVVITGRIANKLSKLSEQTGLWLIEPSTINADLTEGRVITWTELERLQSQQVTELPPTNTPKVRATVQEFQFM